MNFVHTINANTIITFRVADVICKGDEVELAGPIIGYRVTNSFFHYSNTREHTERYGKRYELKVSFADYERERKDDVWL